MGSSEGNSRPGDRGAIQIKLPNLNWQWPGHGHGLGQFVGGVRQHWSTTGMRLMSSIEEGRLNILKHVPKFEKRNPDYSGNQRQLKIDVGAMAQSWLRGFRDWQRDIGQELAREEDRGPEFLRIFKKFNLGQWQSVRAPPLFASMSISHDISLECDPKPLFQLAMSTDQVSRRLDGVPVYTVSNSANEFILISDLNSQKSLGIFCFRQEDAESLLSQVRDREPSLGRGAKVVAVALDKVYKLNTEGIAFRFLPDPQQVKNALDAKVKSGETRKAFDGVPVFQSDNLILRSNNRRFCPIFFCKEDLERALTRAFMQQQRVNPSLKATSDIQVGSFEDVLKRMEKNEAETGWGDIVFIPPGIDAFSHLGRALAQGSGRESVVG